jgi:hypothetical protein
VLCARAAVRDLTIAPAHFSRPHRGHTSTRFVGLRDRDGVGGMWVCGWLRASDSFARKGCGARPFNRPQAYPALLFGHQRLRGESSTWKVDPRGPRSLLDQFRAILPELKLTLILVGDLERSKRTRTVRALARPACAGFRE